MCYEYFSILPQTQTDSRVEWSGKCLEIPMRPGSVQIRVQMVLQILIHLDSFQRLVNRVHSPLCVAVLSRQLPLGCNRVAGPPFPVFHPLHQPPHPSFNRPLQEFLKFGMIPEIALLFGEHRETPDLDELMTPS